MCNEYNLPGFCIASFSLAYELADQVLGVVGKPAIRNWAPAPYTDDVYIIAKAQDA